MRTFERLVSANMISFSASEISVCTDTMVSTFRFRLSVCRGFASLAIDAQLAVSYDWFSCHLLNAGYAAKAASGYLSLFDHVD